jgi:hypothetical protein
MFKGRILENGSDNFLFGPWHQSKTGTWEKHLQDGQVIYINDPPSINAAAVIDPCTISIHPPGYDYFEILRSKLHWGRDNRKTRSGE